LYFKNKTSNQFELAGADETFYAAEASIKNNEVILTSKKVSKPNESEISPGEIRFSLICLIKRICRLLVL
jgi:hypothetical protein